jgi:hypothetical protein
MGTELLHRPTNRRYLVDGFAEDLSTRGGIVILLRPQSGRFNELFALTVSNLKDSDWTAVSLF